MHRFPLVLVVLVGSFVVNCNREADTMQFVTAIIATRSVLPSKSVWNRRYEALENPQWISEYK